VGFWVVDVLDFGSVVTRVGTDVAVFGFGEDVTDIILII
jgi:hypothetical protein